MAAREKRIPTRLKHDTIVEALLEIQFAAGGIPEVLIGRLADCPAWKAYTQHELPARNIPEVIRQTDPNFRFQPTVELRNEQGNRIVKIGSNVVSFHRLLPYVGWSEFEPEIGAGIDHLFLKAENLTVSRLGLRYLNAIQPQLHGPKDASELDLKLSVEDESVADRININFVVDAAADTLCMVRVATPDFVEGQFPPDAIALIDVDVFSKPEFQSTDARATKAWVSEAHKIEKKQFFRLLTQATIDAIGDAQ